MSELQVRFAVAMIAIICYYIAYRVGAYRMFCKRLQMFSIVLVPHSWHKAWLRNITWVITIFFTLLFAVFSSITIQGISGHRSSLLSYLIYVICFSMRYLASRFKGVGQALVLIAQAAK
jgi:hypothetical protein